MRAQRQEGLCAISLPHCRLYSFNRLGPAGCGKTFQEAITVRDMFYEFNITAYLLNSVIAIEGLVQRLRVAGFADPSKKYGQEFKWPRVEPRVCFEGGHGHQQDY